MKAKEYFEKYEDGIMEEAKEPGIRGDGPAAKMLIEFTKEMQQILKDRHVQFDRGVVPVMREQNQKWNAVVNLFEKKYGDSPIRRDGFYRAMRTEIPELPELNGGNER